MYTLSSERPFVTPTPAATAYPNNTTSGPLGRTGINLAGIQRDILLNTFFTANGNALFDSNDKDYFQKYVPFRYMNGGSAAIQGLGESTQYEMWPISAYSFP